MSDNSTNNKRIAKNTLMLYFRMLLMMGVSLYTSRVVLNALGVENYGIYSVVGGVVGMFTMISGSLSTAISRFITFELGKGDKKRLSSVFSTSIIIQMVIGAIIAILVETIGVWFLANKMVIPADRLFAAKWVLQISLVTLIIQLISIPYNAAIIAHERMSAFAYISIIEGLGKLAISYLITISPIDKLIFYAILMALVSLITRFIYSQYCRRNFEECKFRYVFDKDLLKEMFSFAGWNFIGSSSAILRNKGGNILLNIYGGPIVNAAMSISNQVCSAVTQFSSNFMMALTPQITKSYASGDNNHLMKLIFKGALLSFYMLFSLSLPVIINTEYIIYLWLGNTPEYTIIFIRLTLLVGLFDSISIPLIKAAQATGNIKKYQLIVGGVQTMVIPITYLMLSWGFSPPIFLIVSVFISICCLFSRLYLLRGMIGLSINLYLRNVLSKMVLISIIAVPISFFAQVDMPSNFFKLIASCLFCILTSLSSIYIIGLSKSERNFIKNKFFNICHKN